MYHRPLFPWTGFEIELVSCHCTRFSSLQALAQNRPRQACRPALRLERNLVSTVRNDLASSVLQPLPRNRIALQHQAFARGQRQHIWPHRRKLILGHIDQPEVALLQLLPEWYGQQWGIDHSQPLVNDTDQGEQVQASLRPA